MNAEQEHIEVLRDAWAGLRADDLHASPERLAAAIDDLRGDARAPLVELLAALMSSERTETALDRIVLQHSAAMEVIDRWVKAVVTAEDRNGDWQGYAESEG